MVLPDAQRRGEEHQRPRRILEGRRGYAVTLDPVERLFLARACELAARAGADAEPNPPVGAIIVAAGRILGEGWHHRKGEAHAEAEALRAARSAGHDVRDATMYVTLEPHDHVSTMPPCSLAIIEAGIARVVVGAVDPNPKTNGRGISRMRNAGIVVDVIHDVRSLALIERFTFALRANRPWLTLKLATSLDGLVAPRAGENVRVTGEAAREVVFDLRAAHDAVMVGAGTVRIDDPQLTPRPHRSRRRPYRRIVVCETAPVPNDRRIFAAPRDAPFGAFARTIVLAPLGLQAAFAALREVADLVFVGSADATELDLSAAMSALADRGITSILCEGGPTLAGRLMERELVDRIEWFVAPRFFAGPTAVPALAGTELGNLAAWQFDAPVLIGDDVHVVARRAGAVSRGR